MKKNVLMIILFHLIISNTSCQQSKNPENDNKSTQMKEPTSQQFSGDGLATNTAYANIPLEEVLKGGPVKDGIPALSNPKFNEAFALSKYSTDNLGVFIQSGTVSKFYPYNILVWHEIINDTINGHSLAVTFCPLCGSAIVFDRTTDNEIHEFGVSGKLWQSNMLMYDKKTESLWSQIEGKAMVGDLIDQVLDIFPSQLLTHKEALEIDPKVLVLSSDTGYTRNYNRYPYGDYEQIEKLYFPIKYPNEDLPAKTLVVATTIAGNPIAFHRKNLLSQKEASIDSPAGKIIAKVSEHNEIIITDEAGNMYPSYISMWFSWANHNKGIIWK